NGKATVTYAGTTLVEGQNAKSVTMTANADKTLSFAVDGTAIATPTSGSLSGLSSSAVVARDRLKSVNDLATQFATDLNGWHSGSTTDGGAIGGDLVTMTAGDATTLTMAITSTDDIATRANGATNGNLVQISTIRGTNGVENGWTALIAQHANLMSAT